MSNKESLKKQLFELRMQIRLASDDLEKENLKEQVDNVRKTYSNAIFEEVKSKYINKKGR